MLFRREDSLLIHNICSVWWIRASSFNAHSFFHSAHLGLIDFSIVNILGIDQLVKDFDVGAMQSQSDTGFVGLLIRLFSPFGSLTDKTLKLTVDKPGNLPDKAGLIGAIIGITGASLALADYFEKQSLSDTADS